MNVTVAYGDALQLETPLLALTTWEDEPLPAQVAALVEDGDWNGKFKHLLLLYPRGGLPARRVKRSNKRQLLRRRLHRQTRRRIKSRIGFPNRHIWTSLGGGDSSNIACRGRPPTQHPP